MRALYCTCAIVALLATSAHGQTPPPGSTAYIIFLRGFPIGQEDITVRTTATGTTVTGRGTAGSPINSVLRNAELQLGPDGQPKLFSLDGFVNGGNVTLRTTVDGTSATTEGTQAGKTVTLTHAVSSTTVMVPSGIFTGFAALASRLRQMRVTDEFPVFFVPEREVRARIVEIADERMQRGTAMIDVRRYQVAFSEPGDELIVHVTSSPDGALVRVNIPRQALDLVRADLAGATSRTDVYSNPGDQAMLIPAPGFNLGATLTLPPATAPATSAGARRPAVILVAGHEAPDRDTVAPGAPMLGQLAGALADAGYVTLRYDHRGSGQSGGRSESATIADYAEDVRVAARWLANRKDVDSKRIAVIGHDEGAWIGLLAASRDGRIAAIVSLATAASKGADVALEQQQLQLDRMGLSPESREARVTLQKQIHAAVLTGAGWDKIAPELRRRADTPFFQSFLAYDPAKVIDGIDAPILVIHGDLDREVPVAHADRLATFARNGDSKAVELVTVRGMNHILLPAFTGETGEYPVLTDRMISKDLLTTVIAWLGKTLPPPQGR